MISSRVTVTGPSSGFGDFRPKLENEIEQAAVLQLRRLDLISGLKLPGDQFVETRWRRVMLNVARG